MNHLKVSIIIPIYNTPRKRLEILFSSLQNAWERFKFKDNLTLTLIIVNDGSKEKATNNFIESLMYESIELKKINLKNNVGRSRARNIGIKELDNGWVTFLDSDDEVLNNYFETITKYLTKYQGKDQISFGYLINTIPVKRFSLFGPVKYQSYRYKGIWSTFLRTELLKSNKDLRFEPGLDIGEDSQFLEKVESQLNFDRALHVNIPIYNYKFDFKSYKVENSFKRNLRPIYYRIKYQIVMYFLRTPLISQNV